MSGDVNRNVDMVFKASTLGIRGVEVMSQVLFETLRCFDKNKSAKALSNYQKSGGELEFCYCDVNDIKNLSRKFEEAGIQFIRGADMEIPGKAMLIFSDIDHDNVAQIVDAYRGQMPEQAGIVDRFSLINQANGKIRELTGLSREEAVLIAEHAKENKISVSVQDTIDGKARVTYADLDRRIMNNIKRTVAMEVSGTAGKALCKQINYEEQNMLRIGNRILAENDVKPRDFYVTDENGKWMHVTDQGIECPGENRNLFINREDANFKDLAFYHLMQMENPVDITSDNFEVVSRPDMTKNERVYALYVFDKDNGRPELNQEEYEAINRMNDARILYEQKLAEYNPEQEVYSYAYTNNEMRMAAFEEYEAINENAVHDRKEILQTQDAEFATLYDEANSRYRGYNDYASVTTCKVEQEQEQVLDGERENTIDFGDPAEHDYEYDPDRHPFPDVNQNYIPDDEEIDLVEG